MDIQNKHFTGNGKTVVSVAIEGTSQYYIAVWGNQYLYGKGSGADAKDFKRTVDLTYDEMYDKFDDIVEENEASTKTTIHQNWIK